MLGKMPSLTVVVDTNVIYPKRPTDVIAPQFDQQWDECSKIATLRLIVPEIVRGERLYQMVSQAQRLHTNLMTSLQTISTMSGCPMPQTSNIDEIKNGIERSFDAWIKNIGATVAPTPIKTINW